jgi:thioredoxin-related protein
LVKDNGILVIFTCNTCPFVLQWEDRYPEVAELAAKNRIGVALVNSNEAKRGGDDSVMEMMKHATEKGYGGLAYLVDEKSALANTFGAKTTPHIFLFDKEWKLVYEGAIDDNSKDAKAVKASYLKDALNNLRSGKKIIPNNTKAIGCSIKRVKV